MKQSCWSCKHCINDYFAMGTMDCKRQDDMRNIINGKSNIHSRKN